MAAAYFQDFDSDDEDPAPYDTDDIEDELLLHLGWYKPLGYRFLSEITGLTELTLREAFTTTLVSPEKPTYHKIDTYFTNGQCHSFKMRMTKLFRIRRFEDANCFSDEAKNNKLLWHGTKRENITSILTLGFTRPVPNGQMFGTGIYFADRVSKSAQYCDGTDAAGLKGYIFLCAVSLGKSYLSQMPLKDYKSAPVGYDSILGAGKYVPDNTQSKRYHDSEIPCGPTVTRPQGRNTPLRFNEYIIYEVDKIIVKFLVEFEIF